MIFSLDNANMFVFSSYVDCTTTMEEMSVHPIPHKRISNV
jgi:hypothetical protein